MNKIAAGYRFTFNSTDIRDENPQTIIKEGLTETEASLFAEISEEIQGYGATYLTIRSSSPEWRIKKEHERLYNIFDKHSTLFTNEKMQEFKTDVGTIIDYIAENMIGYSYDDQIDMRSLKNYTIEDIPQDIIIKDVTATFKKNTI